MSTFTERVFTADEQNAINNPDAYCWGCRKYIDTKGCRVILHRKKSGNDSVHRVKFTVCGDTYDKCLKMAIELVPGRYSFVVETKEVKEQYLEELLAQYNKIKNEPLGDYLV